MNASDAPLQRRPNGAPRAALVNEAGSPPPDGAMLAELLSRVAATRDRQAYAVLFKHFAPRVKAYLRRAGMEATAAEEVAQEVMLSLWRKAESFDASRAGASTWVFAIARNARIDHARRVRGLPSEPEPEAESYPSAEALTLTAERASLVRGALSALGPDQRQIVQLFFFSDKPHSAIASALDLPLGTVKSRIRLATAKLRAILGDAP
ncbi:sigma-70 family RNA polymerase sigma factor [Acidocella aminolytica]|uniref:DNA-directed RNA polymerase sigma-24 subunit ECF subfamily n=1 Tax=Acidocella aminolytica 101 = DSM 11237 TaxID=1120923 RepID=A0A0D6PBV4_9PROT|nr:sigma-70 family RNA polymerase sigma factor [Acidocella aminolytica]GAN79132.1 DNA-directed RNA polymerase sigma-24 subunit ECF subfamily [Acidocella aminolytica 101 = DSM 11237]